MRTCKKHFDIKNIILSTTEKTVIYPSKAQENNLTGPSEEKKLKGTVREGKNLQGRINF